MSTIDLVVLFGTLLFIVVYGVWKTRGQSDMKGYLLGGNSMKWGTIGLSVMATQASAITFISTPGQGFESGMSFVQNYFGLPLALIVVSAVFIPIFYKLKVYTAYEYLESRFDAKTRYLGAFLFLVQRGLQAGITIYAPAIIISSVLNWNLTLTIVATGIIVIIYTVSGGTKAVSVTQKQQMAVILIGMVVCFVIILQYIGKYASFSDALTIAGNLGKLEAVKFELDFSDRYNIWSGLAGGFFLALSYFGTDQSQVQRYLGGKNVTESRMGLMFNAVLKIPMQFFILLTGVMVYVFYVFYTPPIHFKQQSVENVLQTEYAKEYYTLENAYNQKHYQRKSSAMKYLMTEDERYLAFFNKQDQQMTELRDKAKLLIRDTKSDKEAKDSDYVFLTFIMEYLPVGLVGLLFAVIFSAAMSSISSELNALATTTSVDFYRRMIKPDASDGHYLKTSKLMTLGWGTLAILFALMATNSENLIEAINIVGSIFYGTILGIFLVAFFLKRANGSQVFIAALIAQGAVFVFHFLTVYEVIELGYLWYNVIGCGLTYLIAGLLTIGNKPA